MIRVGRIDEVRAKVAEARGKGLRIAFVPTMGNLHPGHMSLIDEARRQGDYVVASIFVNPLQFGANEDLDSYPRTLEADQAQLAAKGCDLLFAPTVEEMYPGGAGLQTQVDVPELGRQHCGASRPGHFRGVATVVTKLFGIVQPDVAIFGCKDFQQLAVIRALTRDLSLPVTIVGAPTARNEAGLALSSRNGYLSAEEFEIAPALYRTLEETRRAIEAGESDYPALQARANAALQNAGFTPDYFHICRQDDLQPAEVADRKLVILAAAKLGGARLIDNLAFERP
ncbi:pantoate--beta-alanine ligase [Motiliproteus sp. SC1-56]|uniref:pantoate--beta-alanine ligase n=1 Tax=Motiliproteus sp. SC1-56 TaxID=2799565 RepID=UPI001A8EAD38|nr:pantoate--beta-alanine ligase [Motiliproteus sp. SC1-56]